MSDSLQKTIEEATEERREILMSKLDLSGGITWEHIFYHLLYKRYGVTDDDVLPGNYNKALFIRALMRALLGFYRGQALRDGYITKVINERGLRGAMTTWEILTLEDLRWLGITEEMSAATPEIEEARGNINAAARMWTTQYL